MFGIFEGVPSSLECGWQPATGACPPTIQEQRLRRIVKRFRGGVALKAHRLSYHSTLGSRVIQKKKKLERGWQPAREACPPTVGSEDSAHVGAIGLTLELLAWWIRGRVEGKRRSFVWAGGWLDWGERGRWVRRRWSG